MRTRRREGSAFAKRARSVERDLLLRNGSAAQRRICHCETAEEPSHERLGHHAGVQNADASEGRGFSPAAQPSGHRALAVKFQEIVVHSVENWEAEFANN